MERTQQIHEGRNIKRFREMLGMKQETLAYELGNDWTQKKISQLEAKEKIEVDILEQVAEILKVSPEAIQRFDEENALNIISNTFTSHDTSTLNAINHNCTFNPLDKLIEAYEENKKLYERLIEAEKEKVAYLERLSEAKG
ncbi:helix-turn-helix transcriptional regulator [Arcticibacter tournemirensis]|uniref:XRE family transcriptional regulator n=1 Tax=Arcticibacter tournemirensis TaxID=699437 RepID=A0A4Q0M441_9SPHI|nr:helix-turn-helix transcriptional regulator [Arcticibacter tournemirensis]RXF67583.1 XRE family transcriptional regulator [Arcticibacter tournemirensis]